MKDGELPVPLTELTASASRALETLLTNWTAYTSYVSIPSPLLSLLIFAPRHTFVDHSTEDLEKLVLKAEEDFIERQKHVFTMVRNCHNQRTPIGRLPNEILSIILETVVSSYDEKAWLIHSIAGFSTFPNNFAAATFSPLMLSHVCVFFPFLQVSSINKEIYPQLQTVPSCCS